MPVLTLLLGLALPASIHATLDQEYPGWKLAPVSPQVQQEFTKHKSGYQPSLVSGDFDQDGKRDYAVQIALTKPGEEEQIIIFFLARGNAYEETIVQSMGLDPTVYLWVSKMANKDVLRVLGGLIGDTTYSYSDGRFEDVKTEDSDPETP